MSIVERDKALQEFISNSKMAKNWVSLILYYTLEALLSSPIYGGNRDRLGWRWLKHNTPKPQPIKPFGELI